MNTAVLFLIFNRPEQTAVSFQRIREAKPAQLFVAADGPRRHKEGESEKCIEARKITEQIDWPCEVKRHYRTENLGCGMAVSSAISWFFEHVTEGVILEDDCVAHPSFFEFCSVLLEKYRTNDEIMEISGTNLIAAETKSPHAYYFSQYGGIWGWATWKRAWDKYDLKIPDYLNYKSQLPLKSWGERKFFLEKLDLCYAGKIDTWDFQWLYAKIKSKGLSIVPTQNLISNIGYGPESTFTKTKTSFHLQKTSDLTVLSHPAEICINRNFDKKYISLFNVQTNNLLYLISSIKNKLVRFVK